MYRLLVAEDEFSTRKWLSRKIPWEELGFELVAVVENGEEAWKRLVEDRSIHVIMTDIRMPFLDGLELLHRIRDNGLRAEVIILSGFGEFEYAQRAVQHGARDYLLKPITQEQICDVFRRLVSRLDEKQLSTNQSLLVNQLKKEQLRRAKTELLQGWLVKRNKYASIERHLGMLGIVPHQAPYVAVVAEMDDYLLFNEAYSEEDKKLCLNMALNIMEEIAREHGCMESFFLEPKRFVFWMKYDPAAGDVQAFVNRLGAEFQEMIRKYIRVFSIRITVGAGSVAERLEQLPVSFNHAVKAVESKFYFGKGGLYAYQESQPADRDVTFPAEWEKHLIASLKKNDMEAALNGLEGWFNHLANHIEKESILLLVSELLFQLLKQLGELRCLPVPSDRMSCYANLLAPTETLEEMKNMVKELIGDVAKTMREETSVRNPVAQAIIYLKLNLNRDVSLQSVAGHVGMSPSYFSTIFKQTQGEGFLDYSVRLRLEKSLGLLEKTRMSVAQIGEEIGYQSYRYFIKVFKDEYGITPTQYRERLKLK
ncbi:response regulator [Paenibacillus spongiae]|uniref:Response regulator n=1 Tax=Paenibacillus spongiae TaxID=2909671 RepID=A0ABY5SL27_9BACL|nr:response regulator [Paenibacillus spongiae]UVI33387.1 response regulator [Paenibacillus spongiae]